MRLTKQTNFAVLALIYCAIADPALSRVGDIAACFRISEPFLFKILSPLIEAGLLESVRGRRGGVRLGRPADAISLDTVLRLTEDNLVLFEEIAPSGDLTRAATGGYAAALDQALSAFLAALGGHTIAGLANDPGLRSLYGLDRAEQPRSLLSLQRRKGHAYR